VSSDLKQKKEIFRRGPIGGFFNQLNFPETGSDAKAVIDK
jgi:hypothetical protein